MNRNSKQVNVLFTTDSLGISGAEFIIFTIMKNLNKKRFTPFLFCRVDNKAMIDRVQELGIEYKTTSSFPKLNQIGKPGIYFSKVFGYLRALIRLNFELIPYLKSREIDLIYANTYPNCIYYLISSLFYSIPLIWHVHNIRDIHKQNFFIYFITGLLCKKIITVSQACKTNLMRAKIESSKIITIYNGMDFSKFVVQRTGAQFKQELGIDQDTKVVGLFGQPMPEKGHKYFIEAAAEIVKLFPNCVFIIVGDLYQSNYQKYLDKLVVKLEMEKHIIFTGWRDDIPDVMAAIDILAHTRVTPEPAAAVLTEAMAMVKPVVASNTGGTSELVLDNVSGLLVPPADSHALAQGILYLLEHSQLAEQMGIKGRKRIEQYFTLERQMNEIENLIEKLVSNNQQSRCLWKTKQ